MDPCLGRVCCGEEIGFRDLERLSKERGPPATCSAQGLLGSWIRIDHRENLEENYTLRHRLWVEHLGLSMLLPLTWQPLPPFEHP